MIHNLPSGAKKYHESVKLESCQTAFFFRRATSKSCNSFTTVFTQNSSILHWAVHKPIVFSKSTKCLKPVTQKLWLHLQHPFLHLYTCTKHLAATKLWMVQVKTEPCTHLMIDCTFVNIWTCVPRGFVHSIDDDHEATEGEKSCWSILIWAF